MNPELLKNKRPVFFIQTLNFRGVFTKSGDKYQVFI